MAWSRWLRCTCSIVLLLHVASLQLSQEHALQAFEPNTPDAGAAAMVYNSHDGGSKAAANVQQARTLVNTEALPSQTRLGLALPGWQNAQKGTIHAADDQSDATSEGYEDSDYVYLGEDERMSEYRQMVEDAVAAAQAKHAETHNEVPEFKETDDINAEEIALYKQMVVEAIDAAKHEQKLDSYRHMVADAVAAASAASDESSISDEVVTETETGSSTDILLMPMLPEAIFLPRILAAPVTSMATDIANTLWTAFQRIETAEVQQASQVKLQELEVIVEQDGSRGSSSIPATQADAATIFSSVSSSSATTEGDGMQVSVTVESSRPRPMLPFLQNWFGKRASAEDGLDAAAIATAVFKALGQQTAKQLSNCWQQAKVDDEMVHQIKTMGSYKRSFNSNEDLSATTAAAVVAAANVLATDPWDSMEMELEVTHSVQNGHFTWISVALIAAAMVLTHIGLFLLISPWIASLMGSDGEESESDEKQQQFISAGLVEAGLYTKLLTSADQRH